MARLLFSRPSLLSPFSMLVLALALGGCSDDTGSSPDDGGTIEASVDQKIPPDATRCASGIDLAPLAIDAAYCVHARFSAPAGQLAFAFQLNTLWTYEPKSGGSKDFLVRGRPLDIAANTLGAPNAAVFSFSVTATQDLFAGQYLAYDPSGPQFAVGYTLKDQSGAIWSDRKGEAAVEITAKGNYDAIYLDGDTLLINGLGVGQADAGQGVYAYTLSGGAGVELIKDVGSFSGVLAGGGGVIYAGGFTTTNEIWAFTTSEVQAALKAKTTLSGKTDGDLVYSGDVTDAVVLDKDLVIVDDDFVAFKAVRRIAVTINGDKVTKGATSDIVTAPKGVALKVGQIASSGPWLGLALVPLKGGAELAFLRAK